MPGLGRSHGEGEDYPFQYSGLENSVDCIVHGVTKIGTCISNIIGFLNILNSSVIYKFLCESHSVMSDSLPPHALYSQWNSPGQNTGVGSLSLLQGIFPTQGLNPGLLPCKQILYQLSHKGSPRILEWVPYPFSRGSS